MAMAAHAACEDQTSLVSDEEGQGQDVRDISVPRPKRGRKTVIGAVVAVTLALAVLVGVVALRTSWPAPASAAPVPGESIDGALGQLAQIDSSQWGWHIDTVEPDLCSKAKDNCMATKCCKVTSFKCFKKNETFAECKKPEKAGGAEVLSRSKVDFLDGMATSLFCWAVYTRNTGSTKPNHERDILTEAYARHWHIFACDAYEVYSDVAVSLGDDFSTKQVHDVDGTFHFAKRKQTGVWVNTGMFQQVWKAIGEAGTFKNYDWTVKVDADAVFVASRLTKRIASMPRTTTGSFLTNCKLVDYGFFGSLEVFSEIGFSVLLANLDSCNQTLPWTIGIEGGKYGPMGEDLFAEICLEKHGAVKVDAFDIKVDGACPGDRPLDQKKNKKWKPNCAQTFTPAMHPFKKTHKWVKCYQETTEAETRYLVN